MYNNTENKIKVSRSCALTSSEKNGADRHVDGVVSSSYSVTKIKEEWKPYKATMLVFVDEDVSSVYSNLFY
jgi:hypothetical protein